MAKKNKVKIPKRIAGIKIRKRQRKAIGRIVDLLESPEVRTTLGALAGSILARRAKKTDDEERPAVH